MALEEKLVPVFLTLTIIADVISLCARNWVEGYYGDVIVTQLSPWYLCEISCLNCPHRKPQKICFFMQDWANSGFESLSFVQHLEYWSLGGVCIVLLMNVGSRFWKKRWQAKCGHQCPMGIRRSSIVLTTICCLLSTASLSLVGCKLSADTTHLSSHTDIVLHLAWPFYVRVLGALLGCAATMSAISQECRVRAHATYDDNFMVVTSSHDLADDSSDEVEEDIEHQQCTTPRRTRLSKTPSGRPAARPQSPRAISQVREKRYDRMGFGFMHKVLTYQNEAVISYPTASGEIRDDCHSNGAKQGSYKHFDDPM